MSEPFFMFSRDREEYWFREGCYILENLNTDLHPELSIARGRVAPGKSTAPHRLRNTTERYIVLGGAGTLHVGNLAPTHVGPGDVAVVPPETVQWIDNTGSDELVFLVVCTPRFQPEVYEEVEG